MSDKKKILAVGNKTSNKRLLELVTDKTGLKFNFAGDVGESINELDSERYRGTFIYGLQIQIGDSELGKYLPLESPSFCYSGGLTIVDYARRVKELPVIVHQVDEAKDILKKAKDLGAKVLESGAPTGVPSDIELEGKEPEKLIELFREIFC